MVKRVVSMFISVLLIMCSMSLSASAFNVDDANAAVVDATEDLIETIDCLTTKELNDTDLIRTTVEQVDGKINIDAIKEVADNGIDLFIEGSALDLIADKLGGSLPEVTGSDVVVGGYVSTNGTGYSIAPVCATLVEEDANDPIIKNDFSKIRADDFLDYDELFNRFQNDDSVNGFIENMPKENLAMLQVEDFGSHFHSETKAEYWLKKGEEKGTSTKYQWNEDKCINDENGDEWNYIASIMITPYIIKCSTNNGMNFDYVYCYYAVSPRQGTADEKAVEEYTVSMYSKNDNTSFIQYTDFDGGDESTEAIAWGSLGMGVTIGPFGMDASKPLPLPEYSWNPNGQDVYSGFDADEKIFWHSDPCGGNPGADAVELIFEEYGKAYNINPSALVASKVGTKAGVSFGFDRVQLYGGVRWYTITQRSQITLYFKNHTAC